MKTPCLGAVPLTRVDPRPAGSAQLADVQEGWGGGRGPLVTPQHSSPRDTSPLVPPLLRQPPSLPQPHQRQKRLLLVLSVKGDSWQGLSCSDTGWPGMPSRWTPTNSTPACQPPPLNRGLAALFFPEVALFGHIYMTYMRLPRWLSGKESAYNAGGVRDVGLIPGSERSLEEGMATHSSILAWRISWTEEPGGL